MGRAPGAHSLAIAIVTAVTLPHDDVGDSRRSSSLQAFRGQLLSFLG
jgi:hypothetical protein